MSYSGINVNTRDYSILRVTNTQRVTCSFNGEVVVLDGSFAKIQASGSAGIDFVATTVFIRANVSTNYNNNAPIGWGSSSENAVKLRLGSTLIWEARNSRNNCYFTEITESSVIESEATQQTHAYTAVNAILVKVTFNGIKVWEPQGQPSQALDITAINVKHAILNWESPRIRLYGFGAENVSVSFNWLGQGRNGDVTLVLWNPKPSFNPEIMYLTDTDNRFYMGFTASWLFKDEKTKVNVSDALLVYRDNRAGAVSELGRYTTNSNGILTGIFDSDTFINGADIERPVLHLLTLMVIVVGANNEYQFPVVAIIDDQGKREGNYPLDGAIPQLELRSYEYLPKQGFNNDVFVIDKQIGEVNADGSVKAFENFFLTADEKIQLTKQQALALSAISNLSEFYQHAKAVWRETDNAPLLSYSGKTLLLNSYSLAFGNGLYSYSSSTITTSATLATNADFNAIDGNIIISSQDDADKLTGITLTGNGKLQVNMPAGATLELDNIKFDSVLHIDSANELTVINKNGSDARVGTGNVNFLNSKTVTLTGLVVGTEIRVYTASAQAEGRQELAGIESVPSSEYQFSVQKGTIVDIMIFKPTHDPADIYAYTVDADASIPINQIRSRYYQQ